MKLLIADDDTVTCALLGSKLRKQGYSVTTASDGEEAWAALQQPDPPRLAVIDWQMPKLDGVALCRRIREQPRPDYTYVILLTSRTRSEDIVTGLEAGADDYVAKPFDAQELQVRLRTGQRILELFTQLELAREALREKAERDALTALWNRGAIMETLEREIARADREGRPVGLLLGDVDYFKRVNDNHGHLAGDAVLRETARRLLANRRAYDHVGRYGGEEFLIVAPGCDIEQAAGIGERMRGAIAAEPMEATGVVVPVAMSFGATCYHAGSHVAVDALVQAADTALYRAKELGRNRVESLAVGP